MKTIKFCLVFVSFAFFLGYCQNNSFANNQTLDDFFSVFETKQNQIREFLTNNSSKLSRKNFNFFGGFSNLNALKRNILIQKKKIKNLDLKSATHQTQKQNATDNNTTTVVKMYNPKMFEEIPEEEIKNISLARVKYKKIDYLCFQFTFFYLMLVMHKSFFHFSSFQFLFEKKRDWYYRRTMRF